MRRSIFTGLVVIVFLVLFSAAPAHADSVEYKFASDWGSFDYVSTSGFVGSHLNLTGAQANCSAFFGCSSVSFNPGFFHFTDTLSINRVPFFFELGSFSSVGKHDGFFDATLWVTSITGVPEPSSLMLLGAGLFALAGFALKKTLA